jgi:DNA-binding NarL/FixJ family response regulator
MKPKQVLIVEDDSAFRARYADILGRDVSFDIVASVGSGGEGLAMLDLRKPDILLVDLGLPDISGIELIRHASATLPNCECMVVTVFGDEEHVVASIEAGACGYLLKDATDQDFLGCLHDLINGGSPISPVIARRLLKRFQVDKSEAVAMQHSYAAARVQRDASGGSAATLAEAQTKTAHNADIVIHPSDIELSEREKEILTLASKGYNYPEIGNLLSISPHTVTTHVKKCYKKLAVHSRSEAVFEANRMGLIRTL